MGPKGESIATSDTNFVVRNKTRFTPLAFEGLSLSVASHSTGVYGTSAMKVALTRMVSLYRNIATVKDVPQNFIPDIESQGASLPWGGLFDYKVPWQAPHCSHRDGNTIDISINSVFTGKPYETQLKASLAEALIEAGFNCWVPSESPSNPSASHWHLKLN